MTGVDKDIVEQSYGAAQDILSDVNDTITTLRAEVERLQKLAVVSGALSLLRCQMDKVVAATARAEKAEAALTKVREALTPSTNTKAAFMGEFSIQFPETGEDGEEYTRKINVPWTTIKEIMAAVRALASLTSE